MVELTLPWPPSVNHYWQRGQGRTFLSKAALAFQQDVGAAVLLGRVGPITGPVALSIEAFPPDDARTRDLDNLLKATCDALQASHVLADDSQVARITITRRPADGRGRLVVRLAPFVADSAASAGP